MKPSWDVYYLSQCFLISQRSLDPNTKCGAVIVSEDNRVLSQGYNGPLKNSCDGQIPLTRPEKYYHMIHAEENAILAYNGSYQDIKGATIYITGAPCHKCLRMIIQKGITRIVYPEFPNAMCQDEDDLNAAKIMLQHHPEVFVSVIDCIDGIYKMFSETKKYIDGKISS